MSLIKCESLNHPTNSLEKTLKLVSNVRLKQVIFLYYSLHVYKSARLLQKCLIFFVILIMHLLVPNGGNNFMKYEHSYKLVEDICVPSPLFCPQLSEDVLQRMKNASADPRPPVNNKENLGMIQYFHRCLHAYCVSCSQ